jgi:hypothetical protein
LKTGEKSEPFVEEFEYFGAHGGGLEMPGIITQQSPGIGSI